MKRRDFLKFTSTGLAVVAVGSMAEWPMFWHGSQAHASSLSLDRLRLDMVEVDAEMVTGTLVPMWAFTVNDTVHGEPGHGPRIPGPAMVALTGDRIRLRITNQLGGTRVHRFAIPGVTLTVDGNQVQSVVVPRNDDVDIEFTAPAPGTYVYLDPENAPVNRMMGLHGVLVVLPDPIGNRTPYLNPTTKIQALFDDLGNPNGTSPHFPGNPWDPARNAIWVFNVVHRARCVETATASAAISPDRFSRTTGFLPEFFTFNGKSGFFSAQHNHPSEGTEMVHVGENQTVIAEPVFDLQGNISIRGNVGQPMLIRNVNVGGMWHSPHIHGNHVYLLSRSNFLNGQRTLLNNLHMVDTWTLAPGDVEDLLLPFIQPPDIPAEAWPPVEERFPLIYPMHDHNEISNTAAGGNYPQGIATHWQIDGPFDPTNPALGVISVTRAELRVKTGQLLIDGRFSVPSGMHPIYLDVHAGGPSGEPISDRILVGTDGRFSFRGRSLKAIGRRFVTLMYHGDHDDGGEGEGEAHGSPSTPTTSVPLRLR
ncbi:MAG: multicopper oxidase domain-containing protein [Desulfuromonadales bacterium]|nr:multicopper oxidase domain-containing protein [Desulfuromonadales bacterium]